VEQSYVIKVFVQVGMKGVEVIGRLNRQFGRDALQRPQVCYWTKELKSGKKGLSNIPPPGRAPDEGLNGYIERALQQDPRLSKRKIAKAVDIRSTTVPNHLTKSLGMKCYHICDGSPTR
jgi:hypothetical protein